MRRVEEGAPAIETWQRRETDGVRRVEEGAPAIETWQRRETDDGRRVEGGAELRQHRETDDGRRVEGGAELRQRLETDDVRRVEGDERADGVAPPMSGDVTAGGDAPPMCVSSSPSLGSSAGDAPPVDSRKPSGVAPEAAHTEATPGAVYWLCRDSNPMHTDAIAAAVCSRTPPPSVYVLTTNGEPAVAKPSSYAKGSAANVAPPSGEGCAVSRYTASSSESYTTVQRTRYSSTQRPTSGSAVCWLCKDSAPMHTDAIAAAACSRASPPSV